MGISQGVDVGVVLAVLRVYLGLMILAHGYHHFFGGGRIPGTAKWFESIGVRPGVPNAVLASATEVGVGVLLVAGLATPLAAAGLMSLMLVAIATVHRKNGFFIFNRGEGVEYTLSVAITAMVLGSLGPGPYSLDRWWGVPGWSWTPGARLALTLAVGLGAALVQLALFYRPSRAS